MYLQHSSAKYHSIYRKFVAVVVNPATGSATITDIICNIAVEGSFHCFICRHKMMLSSGEGRGSVLGRYCIFLISS